MRNLNRKPFYKKSRGTWYVELDRKQINLGPEKDEAFRRYHEIMAAHHREQPVADPAADEFVVTLLDRYLEWCEKHRRRATYLWYRDRLEDFCRYIHRDLRIEELRPFHVQDWVDRYPHWSAGTQRNAIASVKRAFKWAEELGYIQRSPIAHLKKPKCGKKDVVIPQDHYEQLLALTRDETFRDLLIVTWETGCRPQESLRVEARHVDVANQRWVIPETPGKPDMRVVYLTDEAIRITKHLMVRHPNGTLFRNKDGQPWTSDAVNCAFDRLQIRMGTLEMHGRDEQIADKAIQALIPSLSPTRVSRGETLTKTKAELRAEAKRKLIYRRAAELAPRYSLYAMRHTWITRMLERGVDSLTVAFLAGHKDTSMLARHYAHLSHNPKNMLEQAKKAAS